MTGVGFTVTVIVNGDPAQFPVVDVGVTIYCTVPEVVPLGLVRTWLMVEPVPALAPVIPPVMVPMFQEKVLGVEAVSAILGLVPLHVDTVGALVTTGLGFTDMVMIYGLPIHDPVTAVGVITYSMLPAVELLGLTSVWLSVVPDPALAPVIPPVLVPIVHEKLLGVEEVSTVFGAVLLHISAVALFVTTGLGFTVTVIVNGFPIQEPVEEVGVTMYSTVPALTLLGLERICPIVDPEEALAPVIPPVMVPMVQVKVLATVAVKGIAGLVALQVE
jgi:hypothetical protein